MDIVETKQLKRIVKMCTVKELKEFLSHLPDDTEVWCVQDECFSNGDKAPDYFPLDLSAENASIVEDGILYIGDMEL